MMKKISDAAPAALIGTSILFILTDVVPRSAAFQSIQEIMDWPWSVIWLCTLLLGAILVVIGVCLRSRIGKQGRLQEIGTGCELGGYPLLGGGLLVYAFVILAVYGWDMIGAFAMWMLALSATFLGPWALIIRSLLQAHRDARSRD